MANTSADNAAKPPVETIDELFLALESPLLCRAVRLTGSLAAAEDVVQEAFMKLHAQDGTVLEPRRWLFRTVHNLALNHRRDNRKIVPLAPAPASNDSSQPPPETADPLPAPDEMAVRCENIALVRLGLETLEPRSRELIRLKFTEDLSYQEMAARTGLTAGHVGYLLHHALKTVATELAKTGVIS